jgi:hypothetical protein
MLFLAAVLVAMFTVPAWAIESEFGGYMRTRFYTNQNFTGEDRTERQDFTGVDTRTRLYYTAIFHENLKFVNKFEWDTVWGTGPGGDIGTDGKDLEIKNSYIDANTGPVNWKVGLQGGRLARSFLFDEDFAGMTITYKGEMFEVPLYWFKAYEGTSTSGTNVKDANDFDGDYYGIFPKFTVGDGMFDISPYFLYIYSKESAPFLDYYGFPYADANAEDLNVWFAGIDVDMDFEMFTLWVTGIYQGGDLDFTIGDSQDFKGWLGAIGGSFNLGVFDIHGEGFYATGDDDPDDGDWEQFTPPPGRSYYWSEIMGKGIFDNQESNNSPGDGISNVWALNIGTTVKPMDKLKVALDVWYANLAEDIIVADGSKQDELGTEVDLVITYEVVQNLNLDLVGAYLFAGDATTENDPDDANPYEIGARLSLAF